MKLLVVLHPLGNTFPFIPSPEVHPGLFLGCSGLAGAQQFAIPIVALHVCKRFIFAMACQGRRRSQNQQGLGGNRNKMEARRRKKTVFAEHACDRAEEEAFLD